MEIVAGKHLDSETARRGPRVSGLVGVLLGCTAVVLAAGCEQRVVQSGWDRYGSSVESTSGPSDERLPASSARSEGVGLFASPQTDTGVPWAITLGRYSGSNHRALAEQRRTELESVTGMDGLWLDPQLTHTDLFYGKYEGPDERQADRDLKRWRDLNRKRNLALPGVMMVPTRRAGGRAEFDLLNAKPDARYTLEIGFYDTRFGKEYYKAAEQAVETLRGDGEEAYYYHGADRSSVALGAFTQQEAFDEVPDPISPRVRRQRVSALVRAIQGRFPDYFVNGRGQNMRVPGTERFEPIPTRLAEIPR